MKKPSKPSSRKTSKPDPLKIAVIGAGSIGFTRKLMYDVLSVPELSNTNWALTDISKSNLEMISALCRKDIRSNRLPCKVETSTNRREMLRDADYVICSIRQGGLEAFRHDIEIPLKYGVDQCVGDTLCAGGIMYAQRTIPVLLDFCKDIREVSKPGALLFNYANPMAMNTMACNFYGGVRTYGLCHGVQHSMDMIVELIQTWARKNGMLPKNGVLPKREVEMTSAGLNHQTWFIEVKWRGIDFLPLLLELFEAHPSFSQTEKVRIDVLRRFGYWSTESNGHLSEYLPWYRKRTSEIPKWIDISRWIYGETGGYLRVCTESRSWFETDFPNWLKAKSPDLSKYTRSEEHLSYIIESLYTGRIYRGDFNVINEGSITNLPPESIVEIPCYVDRNGIQQTIVGDLPLACAATCSASARVQEMAVEAAVHGDVTLLKQAMLHDPLVAAVCNTEEIWQMTDEMLVAQAKWLPQYRQEIPAAKRRLEEHVRKGTRVERISTEGAARLKTRTVKEISKDKAAQANAAAADKRKG